MATAKKKTNSKDAAAAQAIPSTTPSASPANPAANTKAPTTAGARQVGPAGDELTGVAESDSSRGGIANYFGTPVYRDNPQGPLRTYGPGGGERDAAPIASTVDAEISKIAYGTAGPDLIALQDKLYHGGFYGGGHTSLPYTPGVRDDATMTAITNWLIASAREVSPDGKKLDGRTADQVLADSIAYHDQTGDLKPKTGQHVGQEQAHLIDLTDPHELSVLGDQFGQAVLGRALTAAEKAGLVSYVHGRENAAGQNVVSQEQGMANANAGALNAAADATAAGQPAGSTPDTIVPVTNQQVDPSASTEDYLRQLHPGEAGAHDMDQAMAVIRDLLHSPDRSMASTSGG